MKISPTLVSAAVVVIASIASLFGFDVSLAEQTEASGHVSSLVAAAGGLAVVLRNIYAKRKDNG